MAKTTRSTMQLQVEDHVLQWPGVKKRKIFGHDGYYVDGRLFAFIGDRGLVIKPPTIYARKARAA